MTSERVPSLAGQPHKQQLEQMLAQHFGRDCVVAQLTCHPSNYASSHLLYELQVDLHDGQSLKLIYKSIGPSGMNPLARNVKPEFLRSSRREADIYDRLLSGGRLGVPIFYGLDADRGVPKGLLLEHVDGVELYQVGELTVWQMVARWLARFHASHLPHASRIEQLVPTLLRRDAAYFRFWIEQTLTYVPPRDARATRPLLQKLESAYDRAVDLLTGLPATLIHGEYYASNVLVDLASTPTRVAPVDWEMTGVGPGVLDLAGLVAGCWSGDQVTSLAHAYYEELQSCAADCPSWERFLEQLTACRIQQAVQWLGWSADWRPPAAHAQDWLSIAAQLCD